MSVIAQLLANLLLMMKLVLSLVDQVVTKLLEMKVLYANHGFFIHDDKVQ